MVSFSSTIPLDVALTGIAYLNIVVGKVHYLIEMEAIDFWSRISNSVSQRNDLGMNLSSWLDL